MVDETQDQEVLTTLTADIVSAHLSNNAVAIDQLPILISSVYEALASLGSEPVEDIPLTSAVSIRASVKPDHVACLECGRKMKMLKRHISSDHNLTAKEYRQRWGLLADHPLVAPNYAARRADLAKKIGLGHSGRAGEKVESKSAAEPAPAKVGADIEPKAERRVTTTANPKTAARRGSNDRTPAKPKRPGKLGLKFKESAPGPENKE